MPEFDTQTLFPISEVTVFEDRGEIVRAGTVTLDAGENTLVLKGLSALFDPLRATVRPADNTVMFDGLHVTYRREKGEALHDGRNTELRDEITTLSDAVTQAQHQLAFIEKERADILRLFQQWVARIGEPLFFSAERTIDLPEGFQNVRTALARKSEEHKQALTELDAAKTRLTEIKTLVDAPRDQGRGRLVADVTIRLTAQAAGAAALRLSYVIPCAVWRPAHELQTTSRKGSGEVTWKTLGTVWQATDEDWHNVQLRLSTERPNVRTELPQVSADVLRLREKTEEEKRTIRVEHRAETAARDDGARGVPGVHDGGEARFFSVPEPISILSNGMPHQVGVDAFDLDGTRRAVARPRHAALAYDLLDLKHRSGMPLLAGPVTLIEDGAFAGQDTIGYVGSGEPFSVCFGRERRVQVRRVLRHLDQERRLLADVRHFVCSAEVRSLSSSSVDVTVEFETPVSEVKQVKVVASPEHCTHGTPTPDENGHIKIPITVEPGKTVDVAYAFHFDTSGDVHIPDPW